MNWSQTYLKWLDPHLPYPQAEAELELTIITILHRASKLPVIRRVHHKLKVSSDMDFSFPDLLFLFPSPFTHVYN